MIVTWEHASKLINNEIVFIFNEFDMLIDKNSSTRLSEEIKRNLGGFYTNNFYNITDGLAVALNNRTLDFTHLNSRINKIINKSEFEFEYKNYLKILNQLKKISSINIVNNILLIENFSNELLFTSITEKNENESIKTMNSLRSKIEISEKINLLNEIVKENTIVIVDAVIPRYFVNTIFDKAFKIYYIGDKEYYNQNENLFTQCGYSDAITVIENLTVENYFNEIYKYAEADRTEKLLNKLIRDDEKKVLNKIINEIDEKEIINLIHRHDMSPINYKLLPYIILYFCKNQNYTSYFNTIFKRFKYKYCCNLIESLKEFHSIFVDYNMTCTITPTMWEELKIDTEEKISNFICFLNKYKQFQIHYNGRYHFINEIFKLIDIGLREYAEVKLIEYIIENDKTFLLSTIDLTDFKYVGICSKYCEYIMDDKDINTLNISDLPEQLLNTLFNLRKGYEKIVNSEWIHQDGVYSCNNTMAPFAIDMNNKQEDYFEEKAFKYNGIRPYITNNLIYFIELDKINIINLFNGEKKSISLTKAEANSNFYVYNKNLIITNNNTAFLVNNECEKKSLNVKIDRNVYNGIRIMNDIVYYFPSSKLLASANINDFISGNSLFKTKTYSISNENEVVNIKDFFPKDNDIFWINDYHIWHFNILKNNVEFINLCDKSKKIFYTENDVYLLTNNSVFRVLYEKSLSLEWITDISDWEKFTCCSNYLVIAFGKMLTIIDLVSGKQKIIKSCLINATITDLIVAGSKLLLVDDLGSFYECHLSSDKIDKLSVELSNSFCAKGKKNMLSYAYRRLSISNNQHLYIISV